MKYYCFELCDGITSDDAWHFLTTQGYELLYSEEEPDKPAKLYGYFPIGFASHGDIIRAVSEVSFDSIDWQLQWRGVGGDLSGMVQIDLKDYFPACARSLVLYPGPGFGDFSHATTRQTLKLMASHIFGKYVLDIGCGSGVLGLAALCGGASAVHAIDIDPAALQHARENAMKNQLELQISFGLPGDKPCNVEESGWVAVMNMISSEQQNAWEALGSLQQLPQQIITSGVLLEQRDEYLQLCAKWGWELKEQSEEDGWLAFRFVTSI